jgi:type IX secretion system PorP/SprF family membrane protein
MKRALFIILFVLLAISMEAQQLPIYSQYLYNKFLINPALAGSDGFTSLNVTARDQWVGYSGAPRTYSISWQTRFLIKGHEIKENLLNKKVYKPKTDGRVGFGFYVFSDHNGLIQRTGFSTAYSYHIWLRNYTQVSMGLALTGYYYQANVTSADFENPNEPWLADNLRRGIFVPNADFGVYVLNPKFDIGLSAQQLFGSTIIVGGNNKYQIYRQYNLFATYNFKAGERSILQPSMLSKITDEMKPQTDIGCTYIYDQAFWAGVAYRTSGAVITNVMFRYVPNKAEKISMYFGYAYDFTSNMIQSATYGTHEITVAVKFGDSSRRYRWLDRY